MEVVQVELKSIDEQFVELRYRVARGVEYQSRNLPSAEIVGLYDFIDSPLETLRERDFECDNYYLPKLGRKLFDWLDGSQRWLSGSIEQHRRGLIIAIDAQGRLGGLPWEILFDDPTFRTSQMSMIYYSLGDLNQALTLCEQSSEIDRAIGDRQGEAASLAQMAYIAYQQGDRVRERELYLQSARIRGSICDYGGLVILRTLKNWTSPDPRASRRSPWIWPLTSRSEKSTT